MPHVITQRRLDLSQQYGLARKCDVALPKQVLSNSALLNRIQIESSLEGLLQLNLKTEADCRLLKAKEILQVDKLKFSRLAISQFARP